MAISSFLLADKVKQYLAAIAQKRLAESAAPPDPFSGSGLPPRPANIIGSDPNTPGEVIDRGIPATGEARMSALPPDDFKALISEGMPLSAQPSAQERSPIETLSLSPLPGPSVALPPRLALGKRPEYSSGKMPEERQLSPLERAAYVAQTGGNPDFQPAEMTRETIRFNQDRQANLESQAANPNMYFDAPLTPEEEQAQAIRVARGMTPGNPYDPYAQRQQIARTPYLPPLTEEMQARKDIASENAKATAELASADRTSRQTIAMNDVKQRAESAANRIAMDKKKADAKAAEDARKNMTPYDKANQWIRENPTAIPTEIVVPIGKTPQNVVSDMLSNLLTSAGLKSSDTFSVAEALAPVIISESKQPVDRAWYNPLNDEPGVVKIDLSRLQKTETSSGVNTVLPTTTQKKINLNPVADFRQKMPTSEEIQEIRTKMNPGEFYIDENGHRIAKKGV